MVVLSGQTVLLDRRQQGFETLREVFGRGSSASQYAWSPISGFYGYNLRVLGVNLYKGIQIIGCRWSPRNIKGFLDGSTCVGCRWDPWDTKGSLMKLLVGYKWDSWKAKWAISC